jgi:hypothetical protein
MGMTGRNADRDRYFATPLPSNTTHDFLNNRIEVVRAATFWAEAAIGTYRGRFENGKSWDHETPVKKDAPDPGILQKVIRLLARACSRIQTGGEKGIARRKIDDRSREVKGFQGREHVMSCGKPLDILNGFKQIQNVSPSLNV